MSINDQVDGYAAQVGRLVVHCALARNDAETADVFLWSAWRCLEAMLRALLVPYPPRRFNELGVKGLLDDAMQRTIIPVDHHQAFETVWRYSRSAARVREFEQPDYAGLVPECSKSLATAARWFFEKSSARREVPADVEEGLGVLEGAEPVTSREQAAADRQRALIEELEAGVEHRRGRIAELEGALGKLGGVLDEETAALESAEARLVALRAETTETNGYPRYAVPLSGPSAKAGLSAGSWKVVAAALVGLVMGAAVWSLVVEGDGAFGHGGEPPSAAGGEVDGDVGVVDGGWGVDSDGGPIEGDRTAADHGDRGADDAGASGGPRCPENMIEFDEAEVRVIQPYPRPSWPAGPKALKAVHVDPFCLDREPVLVESYDRCVAHGACRQRVECLEQPRNFPVNCVTWENASAYCRWRGGTLPSVLQWERTLLQGKVRASPATGTWEWTADPYPAAVLDRGPVKRDRHGEAWGYMALQKQFVPAKGGRRMCSWHKAPASAKRGNLSFRCAIALAGD